MVHLALGTAQFGMDYGVTNREGKTTSRQVRDILKMASERGIRRIDTAAGYGNAEEVVGENRDKGKEVLITSKINIQDNPGYSKDLEALEERIRSSVRRLGVDQLDTLLVHNPECLKGKSGRGAMRALDHIKSIGLTNRVGVSIYSRDDITREIARWADVIQAPVSLYDQRLMQGSTLQILEEHNCAVQARSIYMQGLLLTKASEWPDWIQKEHRDRHARLEAYLREREMTLIGYCIDFIKSLKWLETAVVGVCNLKQLEELMNMWSSREIGTSEAWDTWAMDDSRMIDPRNWKRT